MLVLVIEQNMNAINLDNIKITINRKRGMGKGIWSEVCVIILSSFIISKLENICVYVYIYIHNF